MHKLLAVATLMIGIIPLAPFAAATEPAATEPEFTPLEEVDRARQAGCDIADFEAFLAWYTSATSGGGWLEQVVFTDYMVNVGKFADPGDPGYWVDRQDYLGQFRLSSGDYRFSGDAASPVPPDAFRRITLTRLSDTKYRVDWRGGPSFAGVSGADRDARVGAYIFEHKKDCWYLTGDLR